MRSLLQASYSLVAIISVSSLAAYGGTLDKTVERLRSLNCEVLVLPSINSVELLDVTIDGWRCGSLALTEAVRAPLRSLTIRQSEYISTQHIQSLRILKHLESIRIEVSPLTVEAFEELKQCSHITSLSLCHTGVRLDDEMDLSGLVALNALEYRDQSTNADITFLPQLPSLKEICLAGPISRRGYENIASQKQLNAICLVGAKINTDDLQLLATVTSLRRISLEGCDLCDISGEEMGSVGERLLEVSLENSQNKTSVCNFVRGLRDVADLNLNLCGLEGKDLACISHLVSLKRLRLVGNDPSCGLISPLGRLSQLEELILGALYNCSFDEQEFHALLQHRRLRVFSCASDRLTNMHLIWLSEFLEINKLYLRSSKISDAGLIRVSQAQKLQELSVGDVSVSDVSISAILRNKAIRSLALRRVQLKMAGISIEEPNSTLECLEVSSTSVGDEALQICLNAVNLRKVDLSGTLIIGKQLQGAVHLPKVETLILRGTKIGAEAIRGISSMPFLRWLDIRETNVRDDDLGPLGRVAVLSYVDAIECPSITLKGMANLRAILPHVVIRGHFGIGPDK